MSQVRNFDYGAPRRTRLLNSRFLNVIPSRVMIAGYDVTATSPASLSLDISAGTLITQDGVVIQEDAPSLSAVTIIPNLTYPRIDWIVAEHTYSTSNGPQVYTVAQGTPGSPPLPPALPDHSVKLAEVWVPAGAFSITQDMIYPEVKASIDNTSLPRGRWTELQPVSTAQTDLGVSNKILVRGGKYGDSLGKTTVSVADQLTPEFNPVTAPGNERIDIVTLDDFGVIDVVEGTEAAIGLAGAPEYPTDKQVVAEVLINEVTPDVVLVSPDDVVDVRFFFNLGGGGSGGGGLEVERYDTTASSQQTLFALPWAYTPGRSQIIVISSGTTQTKTIDYLETSSTEVTFTSGRALGETVSFVRLGGSSLSPARIALHEVQVATAGQTIFILTGAYVPASNGLMVFKNGKKLIITNDYTETDGNTVTLETGALLGDELEFVVAGSTSDWIIDAVSGTATSMAVNGGFKIWQRGNGPFTTTATMGPDEWMLSIGSGCTLSVFPNTVSMKYGDSCAEVNAVKGAGNVYLMQGVEDYKSIQGASVTFSLWAKSSVPNSVRIGIGDYNGATGSTAASSYHTGSGSWERLVVTKVLRFGLASFPTNPHDFGAWLFVDFQATESGVLLDGGMFVTGIISAGLTYVPHSGAEELERCQRFYESGSTYGFPNYNPGAANYNVGLYVPYVTAKSTAPTVTVFNWVWGGGSAPSTASVTAKGFRLNRLNGTQPTAYSADWKAEVAV